MRNLARVVASYVVVLGVFLVPFYAHAAIQYIGSNTGGTNTTYPAGTLTGDFVVAFIHRENVTPATLAAGWTSLTASGSGTQSTMIAFRYAQAGAGTNTGTFTNANSVDIHVYRGTLTSYSSTSTPNFTGPSIGTSATVAYPAITLTDSDGSSHLVWFVGQLSNDTNLANVTTGMTNRSLRNTGGGTPSSVAGHDSNGGVITGAAKSVNVVTSAAYRAYTIELRAPDAVPIVTLSAASTTIGLGQSTTLTWSATDSTSCTASGGWSGTVSASGSTTTSPLQSATTYTLTCTGPMGTASSSVTIAPGITIDNVNTTTQGFRVFAYDPSGATTTIAIHGTAPQGYGVTGVVGGDNTEIGNNGTASEKLRVIFDNPVATSTVQLAWLPVGDFAIYQLFNAAGTLVASGTIAGVTDDVDPAVTLTAGGAPYSRIDFTAPPPSGDYLVNNIVFFGSLVVTPSISGYTNTSEPALTQGGRAGQSITITGTNFGSACITGTNFITIGTYTVPCASVSSWSSTSITFTIPSSISSLGGTGTNGLKVIVGVNTTSGTTFFVYPGVTAVAAVGTNAAREYSASDTSGLIQLIGTAFGTTTGTIVFSGSWGVATGTIHAIAEGSCTVGGWASTTVCVEVPASIADNAYTATTTLIRADGATTTAPTLTILPRITSVSPSTTIVGATTTITGNHFCEGGVCPSSFSGINSVTFGATAATTLVSWTDTQIVVLLPSGVATGTNSVLVTSNNLTSNTGSITVVTAPTVSLTAASTTIAVGGSTTLTWSSTDATSCTASGGWSGARALSGSTSTGALATTTTFTLACTGAGGTATSSVTVTTVPVPTITFTSATSTVLFNASTTLTWSTTNATACTASGGWSGARPTSGSTSTGALATTTTFTLACTGIGGTATSSVTVSVIPLPAITSFTATPSAINFNASSTLAWSTTNATACTASGGWSGARPTSGSTSTGALATTTTFNLSCTGPSGTATSSVTVNVTPLPIVSSYTNVTDPALTTGGRPGETITITGNNFGSACITGTNFITIGGVAVPCASVTSWTNTSVTFIVPSTLSTAGGTGSNGLVVTAGGQVSSGATFYIYPDIITISPATSTGAVIGGAVTLTGTGFGTTTGTVVFVCPSGNATSTIGSWSTSTVSLTVPAGIPAGDVSCTVQLTRLAGDGTPLVDTITNFLIRPSITAVAAVGTNAAREYSASDTGGLIQLIGTNFGTTTGSIVFSGVWGSATGTIHALAEGSCTVGGWASTTVCVEVPASIADNVYSAIATLTTASGATTTSPTLTILPRITSITPSTAIVGATTTISGNHFCGGGVCPSSLSVLNSIVFGATSATTLVSWTDTQIVVLLPSGVATGTNLVTVTSNNLPSNTGSITVVVAPTTTLNAASTTIAAGGSTTLTWSSTDATSCTASGGWSGARALSGSTSTGALATTTTFTLACTGAGGTATSSVTITTVPVPTITFTSATSTVLFNASTTLTWSSTNATACTASGGWSGARATSGSTSTGALATTTTFTLACSGIGGSATSSVTVAVIPLPAITSFTATPSAINFSASSTLAWSSTNTTACTASGGWSGARATSGSTSTGALATTTTFNLSCTGPSGTATSSVTVTVTPLPTIGSYTNVTEPALTTGGRPGETITITGSNFGSACITGTTFISIGGVAVPCASITSWTSTSITFIVPSTLATSGGTGSNGLVVTTAGQTSSGATFYIYPDIVTISPATSTGAVIGGAVTLTGTGFGTTTGTVVFVCPSGSATSTIGSWSTSTVSLTVPAGIPAGDTSCTVRITRTAGDSTPLVDTVTNFLIRPNIAAIAAIGTNAAREYSATDTQGLIQILGTGFGSSTGTIVFSGAWGSATGTIHALAEGVCSSGGWTGTSVCVEVPPSILDNAYTATTTLIRTDGATTTGPTLTILPRILTISPTVALVGDTITISGNHLCQGGVCPSSLTLLNAITFGSTSATTLISWTDTQIQVLVPSGVATGTNAVVVTTNSLTSNTGSVTIVVAPTVSLTAASTTVAIGGSTTLTWSSTNATACTASGGWSGARTLSGSTSTGSVASSTTFTLACTGLGGTATSSVTVNTIGTPTITFTSATSTVILNASTTLTWSTTNALTCTASGGWSGSQATSSSVSTGALATTTTFNLSCTGIGGTATSSMTVSVIPLPSFASFTATPSNVNENATTTLSWSVANATTCTASGGWSGSQATSGTTVSSPLVATTTFTLACTGPSGTATSSVVVGVSPAPVVASYTNVTEPGLTNGGRAGDTVTITGSNFGSACITGTNFITIGGVAVPCASVTSWTNTSVTFIVPSSLSTTGGVGAGGLRVTTGGQASAGSTFYVYPDITGTSPVAATGAPVGASVTLTGTGFSAATGTVVFMCSSGNATSSITSWSDTSVSLTVPAGISPNDTSCSIQLTTLISVPLTDIVTGFVIRPSITAVAAIGTNAAREYSASDTSGLVQLVGANFGATAGTVVFSGGWGSATGTIHALAVGSCSVGGWTSTSICVEVPTSILDNAYTATVTLTTAGGSSAVAPTLTILPRITNITPTEAVVGDTITISGNHLCQGGVCPVSLSVLDSVTFGATAATTLISWTDTQIQVLVPSGVSVGINTVTVTTSGAPANTSSITIETTVPHSPSVGPSSTEGQFTDSLFAIAIGGTSSSSDVVFKASLSADVSASLVLEIEVKPIGTTFDDMGVIAGAPVAYGGSGTIAASATTTLTNGESYHWRARVRNTSTNELSPWVSFGANPSGDGSGDGSPAAADFLVVTSGPTLGGIGTAPSCTAHDQVRDTTARLSWTATSPLGSGSITNKVLIATSSDLTGAVEYPASNGGSPQVTVTNLFAETPYYYQLVSEDSLGHETVAPDTAPFCTFVTEEASKRINKLSEFYICQANEENANWTGGAGVSCISGDDGAKTFNVFVSEMTATNPIVQTSPFVEVFGIAEASSDFTVSVRVNGGPVRTHTIKNPAGSVPFRVLYYVDDGFNLDYPSDVSAQNVLDVSVTGATTISSLGAKAILNYYYFPTQ